MYSEFKAFGLKVLSLIIAAPLMGGGLLYILEIVEKAWKEGSRKTKIWALTMLATFIAICFG